MPADFRCMLNNSILFVSVRVFYHGNQTVTVYPWASIGFTLSVMRKRFQRQRELIWEHQISNLIDNSIWSKNKMPSVAKSVKHKIILISKNKTSFQSIMFPVMMLAAYCLRARRRLHGACSKHFTARISRVAAKTLVLNREC